MRRASRHLVAAAFCGAVGILAACGGPEAAQPDATGVLDIPTTIGGRPESEFYFQRDRFPAADEPGFVSRREATWLEDRSEVIGVVVGGRARAYPITMAAYHHLINDVIAGLPVLVAY